MSARHGARAGTDLGHAPSAAGGPGAGQAASFAGPHPAGARPPDTPSAQRKSLVDHHCPKPVGSQDAAGRSSAPGKRVPNPRMARETPFAIGQNSSQTGGCSETGAANLARSAKGANCPRQSGSQNVHPASGTDPTGSMAGRTGNRQSDQSQSG